jgi:hypothetical protein
MQYGIIFRFQPCDLEGDAFSLDGAFICGLSTALWVENGPIKDHCEFVGGASFGFPEI